MADDVAATRQRQRALARLAGVTGSALTTAWFRMPSHRASDQAAWVRAATPVVQAGQRNAIAQQSKYLAVRLGEDPDVDVDAALRTAQIDLVEPFLAFGREIKAGAALRNALVSGGLRAQEIGESAVFWAARAANTTIDDARIVGWTRTLTANACAWCTQVAGQTYKTAESASFGHVGCDCGVDPIIGDSNPGRLINDELTES